ncbi:hypothetical protein DID80_02720 [Candidatus Marinamargulisbacteria bacterium SCGC AAA071-K20]|nr:hypothetical protein DID80_02720 [Candidatus Marinamargulisbacteria bacterium SCGC AAA071-K20]
MKLKPLQIINKENNYSSEFLELISNKAAVNKSHTISTYCKKNSLQINNEHLKKAIDDVETTLFNDCLKFSILQFQLCVLTNDFSLGGEYQVKVSFCRNILNLNPSKPLESNHLDEFETFINKKLQDYDLLNASAQSIKQILENYTFKSFDQTFNFGKIEKLNTLLFFLNSSKRLILTTKGGYLSLYFASIKYKKIGSYEVGFMEKELVRSPLCIMALAALSFERQIYIRKEVITSILYQKWMPHFDILDNKPWSLQYSRERNISEGIKSYIFQLRQIDSTEALEINKKSFVKDSSETIIYHELGHVIFNQDILDITIGSTLEATKMYTHNIFISILEILADIAPKKEKIQGPLVNLAKIAKKDLNRATSMFYMYISDVWFYDTDDQYMYDYADLILLILTQYINKDLSVDFKKMDSDFSINSINIKHTIIAYLSSQCAEAALEIKRKIKSADYEIGGSNADIRAIENYINDQFKKSGTIIDSTSYTYNASLWRLLVHYASLYSKTPNMIKDYIEIKRNEVLDEVFRLTAGVENAEKYGYNAKEYLLDLFEALNLKALN